MRAPDRQHRLREARARRPAPARNGRVRGSSSAIFRPVCVGVERVPGRGRRRRRPAPGASGRLLQRVGDVLAACRSRRAWPAPRRRGSVPSGCMRAERHHALPLAEQVGQDAGIGHVDRRAPVGDAELRDRRAAVARRAARCRPRPGRRGAACGPAPAACAARSEGATKNTRLSLNADRPSAVAEPSPRPQASTIHSRRRLRVIARAAARVDRGQPPPRAGQPRPGRRRANPTGISRRPARRPRR